MDETIQNYGSMVYRLAFARTRNREDAEDIFQEVFLRYLQKAPRFESEEHGKAWFLRVTVNCAHKLWRTPWRQRTQGLEDNVPFEQPEERFLHRELQKLPTRYRVVIHLFYYEDMTAEQIGAALGHKPATVRTQLTRARRLLKEILGEGYCDV